MAETPLCTVVWPFRTTNPYSQPISFSQLASDVPSFQSHLKGCNRSTIDFQDVQAQRALTQALLHRDFDLILDLPHDRICPPVPSRVNYLLWIYDIAIAHKEGDVYAFDLGTGASAIYPLLGCRISSRIAFVCSELDPVSLRYAQRNIETNQLNDRVSVFPAGIGQLIPNDLFLGNKRLDFMMCNPPFYASVQEIHQSLSKKNTKPHGTCTGSEPEMITEGGELAFITRLFFESSNALTQITWYSSLIGKLETVNALVQLFQEQQMDNYGIWESTVGSTKRWAVVWTFTDARLPDALARSTLLRRSLPLPNTCTYQFREPVLMSLICTSLERAISKAGLPFAQWKSHKLCRQPDICCARRQICVIHAPKDTWSRSARRRTQKSDSPVAPVECVIEVRLEDLNCVSVHWTRGKSRKTFESLAGVFLRAVRTLDRDD